MTLDRQTPALRLTDDDAVNLLRSMLEVDSVSGAEGPLARWLVDRLASLGFDASIDAAGNALATRGLPAPNTHAAPVQVDLALLGHLDTVPGRIPVRIDEGRLYGRGAVDAKGPLAAFIVAAATAALPPGFSLAVIGAVEEESASSRGARHAATLFRPRACLVGEPSRFDGVTLGYKGRLIAELRLRQPAAHAAGPRPSVAELAAAWWERVRNDAASLNPPEAGVFEQVHVRLRSIWNRDDGLEEHAGATIAFRIPPGVAADDLKELCLAAARAVTLADHRLAFTGEELPIRAPRDTPLVRALTSAIRAEGATPRFVLKSGTSDMNVVAPLWRCDIAAYGPGDSRLDHAPDEHVHVDEFLRSIRVLRRAIEALASPAASLDPAPRRH